VSITYANDIINDGAGAQIQRIIGVIALAEALNVTYVHSPIIKLGYQGWDLYLQNEFDKELPHKWENFLGFPHMEATKSEKIRVWNNVHLEELLDLKRWINDGGQARILLPYPFGDVFPQYLDRVRQKLHNWYDATLKPLLTKSNSFQVAIHVRRGDLHLWESHRMLPNSYYLAIIRELKKYLPKNTEFHIHSEGNISTDKGDEKIVNTELYSRLHSQYMHDKSKVVRKSRDHFEDFAKEGCILHINEDIFQTFHRCVSADIFVMSKGSLSYVMGVYSKGMVLYQSFWHSPLPTWFVMPQWLTLGSAKDLITNGSKLLKNKLTTDQAKKWNQLKTACLLRLAQNLEDNLV
jgi:hypothetical protein